MKSWGKQIFFLTTLVILTASGRVLAQDAGMSDVEIVNDRSAEGADKVSFTPGEDLRYVPRATSSGTVKDSIALQIHDFPMQRAAQKPAERANERQPAKKDDSILTFNFLYYMIQKYKLQDIID